MTAITHQRAVDRFWRFTRKSESCWLWIGTIDHDGYGRFSYGTEKRLFRRAHRFSWFIHRGAIPDGLCILHRCDVRACVNPQHLFLGSGMDNINDMVSKGRTLKGKKLAGINRSKGEQHVRAKLSDGDIVVIRRKRLAGLSFGSIAKEYGVAKSTIQNICNGVIWKHIPIEEPKEA